MFLNQDATNCLSIKTSMAAKSNMDIETLLSITKMIIEHMSHAAVQLKKVANRSAITMPFTQIIKNEGADS